MVIGRICWGSGLAGRILQYGRVRCVAALPGPVSDDETGVYEGDDSASCYRRSYQSVQLLVPADRQLEVSRADPLGAHVLHRVPSQLEHFRSEVLEDGCRVDGCSTADSTGPCGAAWLEEAMHTSHWELKPCAGWAGDRAHLHLRSGLFMTRLRHVCSFWWVFFKSITTFPWVNNLWICQQLFLWH